MLKYQVNRYPYLSMGVFVIHRNMLSDGRFVNIKIFRTIDAIKFFNFFKAEMGASNEIAEYFA